MRRTETSRYRSIVGAVLRRSKSGVADIRTPWLRSGIGGDGPLVDNAGAVGSPRSAERFLPQLVLDARVMQDAVIPRVDEFLAAPESHCLGGGGLRTGANSTSAIRIGRAGGVVSGTRVLVAGASIAGPALAHWLRRRGAEVTVVERCLLYTSPSPRD